MSEVQEQQKPRLTYAEFMAVQKRTTYERGSFAWVIERVIKDVASTPQMKQYGRTKLGRLRMIQGRHIGTLAAENLKQQDFTDDAKARVNEDEVQPVTVGHDFACFSTVLEHYASTWTDLKLGIPIAELRLARLHLAKRDLLGSGNPRERVPTDEEMRLILEKCREHDSSTHRMTKIRCMEDFVRAGHISGRRRGEVERMEFGDFDPENEIYWVHNMKHPTKKEGNDKPFYLWPELWEIVKRQPRLDPENPHERVFKRTDGIPIKGNSLGALYCAIKNELREEHPGMFEDLRMHDNRGDRVTRMRQDGFTYDEIRDILTGHEKTSKALEKHYDRTKAIDRMRPAVEKLKAMQAAKVAT